MSKLQKRSKMIRNPQRNQTNLSSDKRMYPNALSLMPKELPTNPISQFTRRYSASAATLFQYSINDLLSSTVYAATTILGYSPYRAIRLRKLRIWAPVETQGTPVSIVLTPVAIDTAINSFSDLPKTITDTSISFDRPAYVEYRPTEDHPSGSWHSSTATSISLLDLALPKGAIMDVHIEGVMNLLYAPQGYTSSFVGATQGRIYCRTFSSMVPVGVTTI